MNISSIISRVSPLRMPRSTMHSNKSSKDILVDSLVSFKLGHGWDMCASAVARDKRM